eukprot:TRINITY_DN12225_c0_g1_i1.p1 TRINITY_DN12225_c0_g1~~TRINITY_DN12225_c0_g1_i1.p1  ORF type:complete len:238 (-),score=46.95 TRINITY_DN12225_c0_g1_i1:112-825(-)
MAKRVFFDIDIGNIDQYNSQLESYNRLVDFHQKNLYVFPKEKYDDLTADERNSLKDMFESDPNNKGTVQTDKPSPIRAGRLVIELVDDCPKAVENFLALCTGEKGASKKKPQKNLHYKGNTFHRIINDFMAQGGDVTHGDGSGGESIYKGFTFADEKAGLKRKFDKKGCVGMANSGKNSNTSQFFITLKDDCKTLNGNYVCFGQVIEGLEILDKLNQIGSKSGEPTSTATVSDCGVL